MQNIEYGESTECLYVFSVVLIRLCTKYHITGTELLYSLEYGLFGQIVDEKCSVLFLCFFLAVMLASRSPCWALGRHVELTDQEANMGDRHVGLPVAMLARTKNNNQDTTGVEPSKSSA